MPGTIVSTLVDQNVFDDPAIGLNNLKIPESLNKHHWFYRREVNFLKENSLPLDKKVWLELDGINHHALIWLNGIQVGKITSAFQRGKFDISNIIKREGKNAIVVEVIPVDQPGVPIDLLTFYN